MYRYTTPTLVFKLPINTGTLTECYVTLSQADNILIEKELSDMVLEDNVVKVTLSQEETASFNAYIYLNIQLRCKDEKANAYASKVFAVAIDQVLKEGVI